MPFAVSTLAHVHDHPLLLVRHGNNFFDGFHVDEYSKMADQVKTAGVPVVVCPGVCNHEGCRQTTKLLARWTVYESTVQNFLVDSHRDGCTPVLGLRIVVTTALRRLLGQLSRQLWSI